MISSGDDTRKESIRYRDSIENFLLFAFISYLTPLYKAYS